MESDGNHYFTWLLSIHLCILFCWQPYVAFNMPELTRFLNKLAQADLLVLTTGSSRTYCRFYKEGVYVSRMYITDPSLLAELYLLLGENNEINADGITKLKQMYLTTDSLSL